MTGLPEELLLTWTSTTPRWYIIIAVHEPLNLSELTELTRFAITLTDETDGAIVARTSAETIPILALSIAANDIDTATLIARLVRHYLFVVWGRPVKTTIGIPA